MNTLIVYLNVERVGRLEQDDSGLLQFFYDQSWLARPGAIPLSRSLDGTPSTHILKPEPDRFPGLAVNETFCMTLARAVGLNVPNIEYRPIGEKPCRLSPFYDLVSILAWHELSRKLAMKIGGCESVNAFTIGDWKTMANKTGLGWPMIRERMAEISHAILNELDTILVRAREYNGEVAIQLHETIGDRSARMLEALAKHGR